MGAGPPGAGGLGRDLGRHRAAYLFGARDRRGDLGREPAAVPGARGLRGGELPHVLLQPAARRGRQGRGPAVRGRQRGHRPGAGGAQAADPVRAGLHLRSDRAHDRPGVYRVSCGAATWASGYSVCVDLLARAARAVGSQGRVLRHGRRPAYRAGAVGSRHLSPGAVWPLLDSGDLAGARHAEAGGNSTGSCRWIPRWRVGTPTRWSRCRLAAAGGGRPIGAIFAGLSPFRAWDGEYGSGPST